MDHEKDYIVSKVKTGLTTFRDLKLAVTPASIAGYVAQSRKTVNMADVYDDAELARLSPELRFQRGVDQRTGYRTRQMLVAPLVAVQSKELLGVVQFINNRAGGPFSTICEDGVKQLCETLSVAFSQRLKPPQMVRSKYDSLVADALLSAQELELATRSARNKDIDIEQVLLDEFQVKLAAIGQSLAKFFSVPYEPFKPDRIKPVDLLKNLKRSYIEECGWLPLDDSKDGLVVVALDPERVCQTHIVNQIFPKVEGRCYRVTSHREFRQMVDQFFGAASESGSVGDLLLGHGRRRRGWRGRRRPRCRRRSRTSWSSCSTRSSSTPTARASPTSTSSRYRARARPASASARTARCAPYIELPPSYRSALVARLKIMCDLDISERRKPQDGKINFANFGPLDIELRVATIPTANGLEDVVLRILAAGQADPARQARHARRTTCERLKHASSGPTAWSCASARPAPARRPRCTRR